MDGLFVGIDVGTSGCRVAAIDHAGSAVAQASVPMAPPRQHGVAIDQDPEIWWSAVHSALEALLDQVDRGMVKAMAVDGTSGTLLLTDAEGHPLGPGLMYNDARANKEAELIRRVATPDSGALGTSSALAKLMYLTATGSFGRAAHAVHQADWIASRLSGQYGVSDQNNALKLGYDVVAETWPDWFGKLGVPGNLLPQVVTPGTEIGRMTQKMADALGLPEDTRIVAGTTDGVAGFLATGAKELGDAVTSLGSTLVIKQLADRPIFQPAYGVYSHRLGDIWLPGGASNSGGAALARFFDADALMRLSPSLTPHKPTGLHYYPLYGVGERFPVHDPQKASMTEPRPASDVVFLQGLLEGVASIEALAYERLQALGAPALRSVRTVGGGAANDVWTAIRGNKLGVEMIAPAVTEAAFGAARLARLPYTDKGYLL